MTHRAPETAEPSKSLSQRVFTQTNMPHFAMAAITTLWLYFQVTLGTAGVPGPINQAFAAVLGLWTSYVFGVVAHAKGDK